MSGNLSSKHHTQTSTTPLFIAHSFSPLHSPSILDIKLGTHTDHPDCGPAKLKTHLRIDAITTTPVLGYRFSGMNVYQSATRALKVYGKTYAISWDPARIEEPLTEYLRNGDVVRYDVLPAFVEKLRVVRDFLAKRTHNFYAASLLFVYDTPDGEGEGSAPEIRLIDFAHVWDTKEYDVDSGALVGVENVIKVFESMAKKASDK